MNYYLAIDIGASSGRHILGYLKNDKLIYEEIHRFNNGLIIKDNQSCWDLEALFSEIIHGLKLCKEIGKIPISVGIDTWGVDFVLLDEEMNVLGNTVAYRDERTVGCDKEVYKCISEKELYNKTGIQKLIFNTIYQLMAIKNNPSQLFTKAKTMLLIPDYLHYRLSGVAKTEYTNATTTGLINATTKSWDEQIIKACGYPRDIFVDIAPPSTVLGKLTPEIQELVGFNCNVVLPATHDTASAVMSIPSTETNTLYISSGTWSLMGVERLTPDCSIESQKLNFTNEGGYNYRYRYLKNIMGLWMIQSVKKELDGVYSFAELCSLAEKEDIKSIVDCNDTRFLAPKSMIYEIQQSCLDTNQQVPKKPSELAAVVYNSLAICYNKTVKELERINNITYSAINIVGGGANADYLNKLTAKYTRKFVYAGPIEATAIGNIMAQMIVDGVFKNLNEGRECVKHSLIIKGYSNI